MVYGYMYNLDVNLSWSICIGLSFLRANFFDADYFPYLRTNHVYYLFAQGSGSQLVTATILFSQMFLNMALFTVHILMDCLLMFLYT